MEGVNLLGFVVQKSTMVGGWVGGWCKPIIGHNSNSTLGGVELTLSGDEVGLEWRWSWELSWSLAKCCFVSYLLNTLILTCFVCSGPFDKVVKTVLCWQRSEYQFASRPSVGGVGGCGLGNDNVSFRCPAPAHQSASYRLCWQSTKPNGFVAEKGFSHKKWYSFS